MKTVRGLSAIAAAAAVVVAMSACGTAPGASSSEATAWSASTKSETYFPESIDAWNSAEGNQKINIEYFASDAYKEKIRTAIGSGKAPSLIFSWAGSTLTQYVDNKNVVDLTEATKDLIAHVAPSVADAGTRDGKVYAVPNNQSQPILMYFNKDVFAKAGVPVPTTWSEILSATQALSSKGITPFALAGQSKWPELMWLEYLTDRIGGPEVFQSILDGDKNAWSQPAVLDALGRIQELAAAGGFGSSFASVSADSGADFALVYTGRAAMVLQGSWGYSSFKSSAADFTKSGLGFSAFPAIPGGIGDPSDIVGNPSNYWSVSADATPAQQTAAEEYLNKQVFDEDYVTTMVANGSVPPITGIDDILAASDDANFLVFASKLIADAGVFQLSWDQALSPAQGQALLTNLDLVFLEQSTPEQFAAVMNATL